MTMRVQGRFRSAMLWLVPLAAGANPALVQAHDTWLVPQAHRAEPGATLRLALVTADVYPISDSATDPARVVAWLALGPDGATPVSGYQKEDKELAARWSPSAAGLHILAAALHPRFIELKADSFNEYLADEAAAKALEVRRSSGQEKKPGRELYTKLVKSFVQVGEGEATAGYDRPVGHVLEIIPLANPLELRAGETLRVRVLLEGKPAAGLRVSSGHEGLAAHTFVQHVVTDASGLAAFEFSRAGSWFLRTHVIRPLPADHPGRVGKDHPAADWESYWASITFPVLDKPAP